MATKSATHLPFHGKTVLVTGAGSGIGLAIARQFLREGASIVAEDINPEVEQTFARYEHVATLVADAGKKKAPYKRSSSLSVDSAGWTYSSTTLHGLFISPQ